MCHNIAKSSLYELYTILLSLARANGASGSLIRMRARLSRNFMTSQRSQRRKLALIFLVFPSVKFCENLLLHDMDAFFTISFLEKTLSKDFSFLIKNRKIKVF